MMCNQIVLFPFFKSCLYSSLLIDVFVLKIKTPDQILRMKETCQVSSNYNCPFSYQSMFSYSCQYCILLSSMIFLKLCINCLTICMYGNTVSFMLLKIIQWCHLVCIVVPKGSESGSTGGLRLHPRKKNFAKNI